MGVYSLTKSTIKNWVKYPNMMAGSAYLSPASDDLITETVLSSATSSVTFDVSGLAAQGYKHLQIRFTTRMDGSGTGFSDKGYWRFNADTGANYSMHLLYETDGGVKSGAASSGTLINNWVINDNGVANGFQAGIADILDFSSTSKYKTLRQLYGAMNTASYYQRFINLTSGSWQSTSAITSLTYGVTVGALATGSRFSLYASKG